MDPSTNLQNTKTFKLNFLVKLRKIFIVINEKIKDKKIEKIFNKENSKLPEFNKLLIPKKLTAAKVGIDNKKDIFAASTLLQFKNLAAVIVIPDLLTPGIKDIT